MVNIHNFEKAEESDESILEILNNKANNQKWKIKKFLTGLKKTSFTEINKDEILDKSKIRLIYEKGKENSNFSFVKIADDNQHYIVLNSGKVVPCLPIEKEDINKTRKAQTMTARNGDIIPNSSVNPDEGKNRKDEFCWGHYVRTSGIAEFSSLRHNSYDLEHIFRQYKNSDNFISAGISFNFNASKYKSHKTNSTLAFGENCRLLREKGINVFENLRNIKLIIYDNELLLLKDKISTKNLLKFEKDMNKLFKLYKDTDGGMLKSYQKLKKLKEKRMKNCISIAYQLLDKQFIKNVANNATFLKLWVLTNLLFWSII